MRTRSVETPRARGESVFGRRLEQLAPHRAAVEQLQPGGGQHHHPDRQPELLVARPVREILRDDAREAPRLRAPPEPDRLLRHRRQRERAQQPEMLVRPRQEPAHRNQLRQ